MLNLQLLVRGSSRMFTRQTCQSSSSSLQQLILTALGRATCSSTITSSTTTSSTTTSSNAISRGESSVLHQSVMVTEVMETLGPQNGKTYIDMTYGAGGHTDALLLLAPQATVFCLDRDPYAYALAKKHATHRDNLIPLQGRFTDLPQLLYPHGIGVDSVDGIMFDLGVSSMQFDTSERGFSLMKDGPLDMRMDQQRVRNQPSAADVVNKFDHTTLYKILKHYGEEPRSAAIAAAIVATREQLGRIKTTRQLASIVEAVYCVSHLGGPSHVATQTFQALRIFVNNELNELYNGLTISHRLLKPGARCAAISFHSLEDRLVKRHFHGISVSEEQHLSLHQHKRLNLHKHHTHDMWKPLARQATGPTDDELYSNTRSRSAKLRAAIKL